MYHGEDSDDIAIGSIYIHIVQMSTEYTIKLYTTIKNDNDIASARIGNTIQMHKSFSTNTIQCIVIGVEFSQILKEFLL